ncbi:unnamed protein product [Microthlaspi erraticum]|uniref:Uncharacterized protein n=1 Tax=Microthlaspi erraticum TaxID=1685480 RepID=A0A6D2KGG1_9BRAS|nr:unnamed protein product [Microthlaspi erraticum]
MEVVDDWGRKSFISSPGESTIGPFFSNPSDSELLFSSPVLSPPILYRIPHLTPARFLAVSGVPPSVSSSVEANFRIPHPNDDAARALSYNRIQFLPFPGKNSVLVFFPTGNNLDQIGFLALSTGDSGGFRVEGDVFVAKERFFSRILKILVKPISNWGAYKSSSSSSSSIIELGYVMVYSLYSIHWYCVSYDEESQESRPVLSYLGLKQFKRCSISSASWSPHLPGECVVLLENGDIFLFDLNQRHCSGKLRGCKMKVSWEGQVNNKTWLGCEYGWKLGAFIIARSDEVFLIEKTSGSFSVRSLVEIESLNLFGREEFVAFAKAGSDSFRFVVASESYLFLCDQRSCVPLLKWQHDVEKPCFIDVYSLSDLGCKTNESTSCVVVGSFWNAESQMFCYGPSPVDPSSLCVWELPNNLLLPAGKCQCGDCLIREEIMKESLPEWIDWQKRRALVLGFGVLNKYLSQSDESSGFTLIRLTSSGKLEAVKFRASRRFEEVVTHRDSPCESSDEVNLLYFPDEDDGFKFPKRFKYLELEYLSAHAKGALSEFIDSRMREEPSGSKKSDDAFSLTCHEELCEKLGSCGFGRHRASSTVTAVFESINSETSVLEIALRESWSSLPIELLLLAFSNYSELEDVLLDKKKTSLEFLVVPEFPQLPPFFLRKPSSRSSKWSKKEQPGVDLVGPVVPLDVLLTLHEFRNGCMRSEQEFSPDVELSDRCNQISKAARQMANSGVDKATMSLTDEMCEDKKRFIAYSPITETAGSEGGEDQELSTFVSKVRPCEDKDGDVDVDVGGRAGLELFDDMSPVEICFEDRSVDFDTKALVTSKTLLAQWQDRSSSFQGFLTLYNPKK